MKKSCKRKSGRLPGEEAAGRFCLRDNLDGAAQVLLGGCLDSRDVNGVLGIYFARFLQKKILKLGIQVMYWRDRILLFVHMSLLIS